MAITVKKKSLKIKSNNVSSEGEKSLTDLPDLSDRSAATSPAAMMSGGFTPKKKSGEYLVTGILGIVAIFIMIGVIGLQFNEDKSDNPFAYYTTVVNNSFTRVLNIEKKNQGIRDDLLEKAGQAPSWTRQLAHEMKSQERWQKVVKTKITDDAIPTETIKEIYADND